MRTFRWWGLPLALGLWGPIVAAGSAVPNVLLAVADDWGLQAGAYGTPWVRTPAFDRVAREGLLFTRAYTPNAKCAPSRACLLTGRNPWQLEAAANHVPYFPPRYKGWMEVLDEHGWFVGHTAKGWGPGVATNALGQPRRMTGAAFNRRQAPPPASGISATDYAANFEDFLDAVPSGRPWCFWYGALEPHRGYEPGSGSAQGGRGLAAIDRVPAYWPDTPAVRQDLLDYAFEVEHFDRHLGRMLDALERRGLSENTLVLVTSDHGMPFPRVKGNTYEAANHVPLAVRWTAGVRDPGRVVDACVSFIDLAPTFLELAGLRWADTGMAPSPGRSLTEVFRSPEAGRLGPARDHVLLGRERTDVGRPGDAGYPIRGILRDDLLFLTNFEPSRWPAGNPETGYLDCDGGTTKTVILEAHRRDPADPFWAWCFGPRPPEELYDLRRDPDCVVNLAGDPVFAPRLQALREARDTALRAQGDPRLLGNGAVFDAYPYAHPGHRDFHARLSRGEALQAGWVNASDVETAPVAPSTPADAAVADEAFRKAAVNGRRAAEAFHRCHRYVEGWLAHADPVSGLIPRNLRESRDYWNGRDAAADNYAFMVLTAALTDRALLEGRMLAMLRAEARLTARHRRLCDDYVFSIRTWRRATFDLDATIFDSAEYVKDGLLPILEWLGPGPWADRARGIVEDIWSEATVETPFGPIPTRNFEVNGDLLQAGARLFWMTGEARFLDGAERLGDYYLLGDQHPTRHMDRLRLRDHGGEVVNGLTEAYLALRYHRPAKAQAWRAPLRELLDRILEAGRNEHGLLYDWFQPSTGAHSAGVCDTWGYVFDGFYTVHLLDGVPAYVEAVRRALGALEPHYTNHRWEGDSADGDADAIEGALNLYRREPVVSAGRWLETEIEVLWGKQQPDGVIEGWHGDGNFARTSLMYALWKTQGLHLDPWRPDVEVGAERRGDRLFVTLSAREPWTGRLVFDRPRHRENLRLPVDYPRINQFPEWFTVRAGDRWVLEEPGRPGNRPLTGQALRDGLEVSVGAGEARRWVVRPPTTGE